MENQNQNQKSLQIDNLIKIFGEGSSTAVRAVDGVSFDVAKGEFVAIMGASGSGKTTLLNLIATIDKPTSGNILVDGQSIVSNNENQLADYRRDKLGFIFQEYNLLDTLTVYENIALPLSLKKIAVAEIKQKIDNIALAFGIDKLLHKFPNKLSGGERQRTAAARALITNPSVIIADEPTGALDSKNSKVLMELLAKVNIDYSATILTVTHDSAVASFASRVLIMRDGKICAELFKAPQEQQETFTAKIVETVSSVQKSSREEIEE